MHLGVSFNDASGYRVNHDLTPLDILMGGDARLIWQSLGYSSGKEGGGSEECFMTDAWTCKNDQVPLGHPLGSRHPNIGVDQIGGESGVANIDQKRGCSGCFSTEGLGKCVMCEAEHKARLGRGRGVVSTELGCKGFGAKG